MTESQKFTLTLTFAELEKFNDNSWCYTYEELARFYFDRKPLAKWLSIKTDYENERVKIEYINL